MEAARSTKRISGYAYIRVIACFGIIMIHMLNGMISTYGSSVSLGRQILYNAFQNNLMWAVPCFLMVTGALLLDPEKDLKPKRIFSYFLRILAAVFIFGFLYYFYEVLLEEAPFSLKELGREFLRILKNDTWNHMWYLYCLLGIYLLLPVYRLITRYASRIEIFYLMLIIFVMRGVVPFLDAAGLKLGIYLHEGTIYPLYLFLGYYIKTWASEQKKSIYLLALVGSTIAICICVILRIGLDLTLAAKGYAYTSILVMIQAYGIFGLLFSAQVREPHIERLLLEIDATTFGVYLIHLMLVRFVCLSLKWNAFELGGLVGIFLVGIVIFAISSVLTWALKKIPGVKKIL